jgi:ribonuclease-3
MIMDSFKDYEKIIGYEFKDINNLILALTHSSYANENKSDRLSSNERLEFLGDAILSIVISEYIYNMHKNLAEGEMTKARANIVCETSLAHCAVNIELGKFLLLGKGEELTGGRTRVSILSDAFEALIASIYLDGGMSKARRFILEKMKPVIDGAIDGVISLDYKTQLQEKVQKHSDKKIIYEILNEKGPDHNKVFTTQVKIADKVMGSGKGKSKKESEQNAAKVALEKLNTGNNI